MAMSRSFGERSFTTRSPIRILPPEIVLEPGDHPQRRRLPAPRRPDEDHELLVGDLQFEIVDRGSVKRISSVSS
jgi:hypothetical protein